VPHLGYSLPDTATSSYAVRWRLATMGSPLARQLPRTRGVRPTCGHLGTSPWSIRRWPRCRPVTLETRHAELGSETELGVALAFAADPLDDVVAFARKTALPLDRVIRLRLPMVGELLTVRRQSRLRRR